MHKIKLSPMIGYFQHCIRVHESEVHSLDRTGWSNDHFSEHLSCRLLDAPNSSIGLKIFNASIRSFVRKRDEESEKDSKDSNKNLNPNEIRMIVTGPQMTHAARFLKMITVHSLAGAIINIGSFKTLPSSLYRGGRCTGTRSPLPQGFAVCESVKHIRH